MLCEPVFRSAPQAVIEPNSVSRFTLAVAGCGSHLGSLRGKLCATQRCCQSRQIQLRLTSFRNSYRRQLTVVLRTGV